MYMSAGCPTILISSKQSDSDICVLSPDLAQSGHKKLSPLIIAGQAENCEMEILTILVECGLP